MRFGQQDKSRDAERVKLVEGAGEDFEVMIAENLQKERLQILDAAEGSVIHTIQFAEDVNADGHVPSPSSIEIVITSFVQPTRNEPESLRLRFFSLPVT